MEVSALKYSGGIGLHARSPLLRLQSDERLVGLVRRGNNTAFEVLVSRYEARLLAFCRHLLGSREDAEDVLQEVLAAAYNAMLADERPINVKPWLYRIARNRGLNHLRRIQAVASDQMDVHLSENGLSTADKVHEREEFRLLVGDIHELAETQKTALVLREMDALSYEQIAEAMETTVPSVKSLLVRARVSLAEAAEARLLSCEEVRVELGEEAEGLRRRLSPPVRRHLRSCTRCSAFREQLKETNKALAALLPIGPLVVIKKLVASHAGHHSGTAAGSGAAGSGAAGSGAAAAGGTAAAGSTAGGILSAGAGALVTKAAVGFAAAALVTGAAVEVTGSHPAHNRVLQGESYSAAAPAPVHRLHRAGLSGSNHSERVFASTAAASTQSVARTTRTASQASPSTPPKSSGRHTATTHVATSTTSSTTTATPATPVTPAPPPGRSDTQTDPTVLSPPQQTETTTATTTTPGSPQTAPVDPASSSSTGDTSGAAGTNGSGAGASDASNGLPFTISGP